MRLIVGYLRDPSDVRDLPEHRDLEFVLERADVGHALGREAKRAVGRARVAPVAPRDEQLARSVPLGFAGPSSTMVKVDGYVPAEGEVMAVFLNTVGPDYTSTMGSRLVAGQKRFSL